ncbi:FliM/FliN family flagellar motor switch protein [Atlantibacter hermannii]|uniref:FliM/FliN family flagellar motor switch protein n=1 Tax=Atlantibacter hermannii TaxID=565 RepID=UPI0028AB3779|nr:FliM/FliN family flagellar motor switch protein [Atlantibacter hermannii]
MSNKDDLLEQGFELADDHQEETAVNAAPGKEKSSPTLAASMSLLRRIPVTLTLEVASVEVMLADLLNMGDDTVIELDKLAGEPLDIRVNNILLGKAEVVVINEKYGLRVLEFTACDINELTR